MEPIDKNSNGSIDIFMWISNMPERLLPGQKYTLNFRYLVHKDRGNPLSCKEPSTLFITAIDTEILHPKCKRFLSNGHMVDSLITNLAIPEQGDSETLSFDFIQEKETARFNVNIFIEGNLYRMFNIYLP
jgi:hypothetical protein